MNVIDSNNPTTEIASRNRLVKWGTRAMVTGGVVAVGSFVYAMAGLSLNLINEQQTRVPAEIMAGGIGSVAIGGFIIVEGEDRYRAQSTLPTPGQIEESRVN